jgi:enoyl-CoA hydratase
MALCCDIRIASEDAQFGVPEMGLGIIPAASGSQTLPRVIGRGQALNMLLSGQWLKATEARRLKLVNQVVSRSKLLPTAEKLANKIKRYNPLTTRYAKQAINRGLDLSLEQGLKLEANLAASLLASLLKKRPN